MKPLTRLLLALVAIAVTPCAYSSHSLPNLSCFNEKKLREAPLVFGELVKDRSVPGGWSGLEVHFGVDDAGKLTAALREAGDSRETRPVERVIYFPRGDTIRLTYTAAGDTKFRRTVRPGCDRLVGTATYIRPGDPTGIEIPDTLPRTASH